MVCIEEMALFWREREGGGLVVVKLAPGCWHCSGNSGAWCSVAILYQPVGRLFCPIELCAKLSSRL